MATVLFRWLLPGLCLLTAGCSPSSSPIEVAPTPGLSSPGPATGTASKEPPPAPASSTAPPVSPAAPVRGEAPGETVTAIPAALQSKVEQKLTIRGKLVERCPSEGCWFVLEGEKGFRMTVDIEAQPFRVLDLPLGTELTAVGKVVQRGPRTLLEGAGVAVRP